jgi:ubiquinone biosynthesis monooxygenase Coq7
MPSLDHFITVFDNSLRTLSGVHGKRTRPYPGATHDEPELDESQRRHIAGLIRVDHVGEICAQALYQGQALTASSSDIRDHMLQAADEETDHLAWCKQRLDELNSHTSLLNPVWYAGSFAIGALAGKAGDGWNLGFVVETERQVESHLEEHLAQLPEQDQRSRAILEQMKDDEIRHADDAQHAGGRALPEPVKQLMKRIAGIMTSTAYWI